MGELKKVSVLLDIAEFERFESYCDRQGFKKSTLVARLIRDYLDKESGTYTSTRKKSSSELRHGNK